MSSTSLDEDLTVLEDLDFEPACESAWHGPNEERPAAEWYVSATVCPQCGRTVSFFCNGCHDFGMERNGKGAWCNDCMTAVTWHIYSARRL